MRRVKAGNFAMADNTADDKPKFTDKALGEAERRRERQAAALRENLKRRKAQVRERTDGSSPKTAGDPPKS